MRTGNITAFEKAVAPIKAMNAGPSKGKSFQDFLENKLSGKDPARRQESIRNRDNRQNSTKSAEDHSKLREKLEELEEKAKNRKKEVSMEDLQEILALEEIKNPENLEDLKGLMEKIKSLAAEIQEILGELKDQGVIDQSVMEKMEALMNLDISFDGNSGDQAKNLEKLSTLLQGIQQISENASKTDTNVEFLNNLEKVMEEMTALVKELAEKVSAANTDTEKNSVKDAELQQLKAKNESSEKADQSSGKSEEGKSGADIGVSAEKTGDKQAASKDIDAAKESVVGKEPVEAKESALKDENASKEKDSGKEEKSSKVSVTLETTEEPVVERSFLFNQDRTESVEKLSNILTKNPSGFEQNLSQMIEEMTEKISIMKNGEASAIKMQLVPNNLGKLVIQLSTDENALSARVYADTPKVKEMIEGQLEELKEALIDKGLTVESLEVFVGHEQDRALYQKHGPMMMAGQNKSSQISFAEMEAMEEAALKSNPYVEKYQYNRLV